MGVINMVLSKILQEWMIKMKHINDEIPEKGTTVLICLEGTPFQNKQATDLRKSRDQDGLQRTFLYVRLV